MKTSNTQSIPSSERGAAMLAALCLAMVFAISLSSYIALCYVSLKTSTRNVLSAHSAELAEAGMEQALYAQNNSVWTGWTLAGGTATVQMTMTSAGLVPSSSSPTPLNFGNGATGQVNLTVTGYSNAGGPTSLQSQGVMTMPNGNASNGSNVVTISRTLTATGASGAVTASAPVFVNAIAATSGKVTFKAAGMVDSYNSVSSLGVPQTYGTASHGWSAVVASQDITAVGTTVALDDVDLKGFAVGYDPFSPGTTNWLSYGNTGKIEGSGSSPAVSIDSSRIISSPVPYQPIFAENLPSTGFLLPAACCNPAPPFGDVLNQTSTIGNPAAVAPTMYYATGILLSGNSVLTVIGPVVIIVYGNVVIQGNAGIQLIGAKASLTIFAESGSVAIGANGITNLNPVPTAKAVAILSTNNTNTSNTVTFGTAQPFYGVIYFPYLNILVTSSSGLNYYGSMVGASVTINQSPQFHYDIALRRPDLSAFDPAFRYVGSPATPVGISSLVSSVP